MGRLDKYDPISNLTMEQLTLQEELNKEGNEDEMKDLKAHEASLMKKITGEDENHIISLTKPRLEVENIEVNNTDNQVSIPSILIYNTSNSKIRRGTRELREYK